MSALTQTAVNAYTKGTGGGSTASFIPVFKATSPTSYDKNYSLGQFWFDTSTSYFYVLSAFSTSSGITTATWTQLNPQVANPFYTATLTTTGS